MFSDAYGLTQAVLDGRKTMTRRIIRNVIVTQELNEIDEDGDIGRADTRIIIDRFSRYKVGEVVAVAQCYEEALSPLDWVNRLIYKDEPGWSNKMFVRADLMPHQIRITNVQVENLQGISDEDVYKEGFEKETVNNGWGNYAHHWEAILVYYDSIGKTREIRSPYPRDAFAALIDRISGKGTWESNPYVFVYEFELVKQDGHEQIY